MKRLAALVFSLTALTFSYAYGGPCVAGAKSVCSCPGGVTGIQTCDVNGVNSPCVCAVASKSPLPAQSTLPCPADVFRRTAKLFPSPSAGTKEDLDSEAKKCISGQFPMPGWVVTRRQHANFTQVVVDARNLDVIAKAKPIFLSPTHDMAVDRLETADFDGDGTDEIVEVVSLASRGVSEQELSVYRVAGGVWKEVLKLNVGSDNTDAADSPAQAVKYAAQVELTKDKDGVRGLTVTGKMLQGSFRSGQVADVVLGSRHYRWRHGKLTAD